MAHRPARVPGGVRRDVHVGRLDRQPRRAWRRAAGRRGAAGPAPLDRRHRRPPGAARLRQHGDPPRRRPGARRARDGPGQPPLHPGRRRRADRPRPPPTGARRGRRGRTDRHRDRRLRWRREHRGHRPPAGARPDRSRAGDLAPRGRRVRRLRAARPAGARPLRRRRDVRLVRGRPAQVDGRAGRHGAAIVRDEGVLGRAFTIETGDYDRERPVEPGTGDTESPFDELGHGTPDWGVDFSTPARGGRGRNASGPGTRGPAAHADAHARGQPLRARTARTASSSPCTRGRPGRRSGCTRPRPPSLWRRAPSWPPRPGGRRTGTAP